jgi:hypothetical protein
MSGFPCSSLARLSIKMKPIFLVHPTFRLQAEHEDLMFISHFDSPILQEYRETYASQLNPHANQRLTTEELGNCRANAV